MSRPRPFACLCLLLFLLALVQPNHAIFNSSALWNLDHIVQNYAGAWCFRPGPNPAPAHGCANTTLKALLNAHTHNDNRAAFSIAYYDLQDLSTLGGPDWNEWADIQRPVGVCMTGEIEGLEARTFRTVCRFATSDNDHESPLAHAVECVIDRPQLRVIDSCYTPPPPPARFHLSVEASDVLTILGVVIVVPGMAFGLIKWVRAQHARKLNARPYIALAAWPTARQPNLPV